MGTMLTASSMLARPMSMSMSMDAVRWYACVMSPPISVDAMPQMFMSDVATAYASVGCVYAFAMSAAYTMIGIVTRTLSVGATMVYAAMAHRPAALRSRAEKSANDAIVESVSPHEMLIRRGIRAKTMRYAPCAKTAPIPPTIRSSPKSIAVKCMCFCM